MRSYDLIVLGAGPGGEKAAVKAAYFGYKVAIIDPRDRPGGAGIHTGTLPSKTLKETALYLSGVNEKGLYGVDRRLERSTSVEDFLYRKNLVSDSESTEMNQNLIRHQVDIFRGRGRMIDEHTVQIFGHKEEKISGDFIVVATGSTPHHPENIPFDGVRVHDSDTILSLPRFPTSMCIVGAGVIGCEYATIFATMGIPVYLINRHEKILPFLDNEISAELVQEMKDAGVEMLTNTSYQSVELPGSPDEPLRIPLETGETICTDMFLYAAGRHGNTEGMGLGEIGVELNSRGGVEVDKDYRTSVANVFAVGDVIGFPSLASTSMDQGRVAVANIFNIGDMQNIADVYPYGVYTIPEVSCVGISEQQAQKQGLDYCVGRARYRDMPRGKILGVEQGFMKIVFTRDDLVIRGVHIIGKIAAEIVHYGVALVENERTVKQVISTIFNYPTLHDLYKYACYDGLGNLSGHKVR